MKTQTYTSTPFALSGAYIVISRISQQAPSSGDGVIVNAVLHIPHDEQHNIPVEMRFHARCTVMNDCMHSSWGWLDEKEKSRWRGQLFTAPTWGEAFNSAETFVTAEVMKIEMAIAVRRRALVDAEGAQ